MPIYEYECARCRKHFEYLAKNTADAPSLCPECGGKKLAKVLSAFSVGAERAPTSPGPSCSSCSSGSCPHRRR